MAYPSKIRFGALTFTPHWLPTSFVIIVLGHLVSGVSP